MPACASGSAATPPAAPTPTMTTSVSLSLVAMVVSFSKARGAPPPPLAVFDEVVFVRRLVIRLQRLRLEAFLIRRRHHRADARIGDQIPADEVRVAAVVRIAERALMGVAEHHGEERSGAAGETGR